jgi:hypothetical protein
MEPWFVYCLMQIRDPIRSLREVCSRRQPAIQTEPSYAYWVVRQGRFLKALGRKAPLYPASQGQPGPGSAVPRLPGPGPGAATGFGQGYCCPGSRRRDAGASSAFTRQEVSGGPHGTPDWMASLRIACVTAMPPRPRTRKAGLLSAGCLAGPLMVNHPWRNEREIHGDNFHSPEGGSNDKVSRGRR